MDQASRRAATVHLGMPGLADLAGRIVSGPAQTSPPGQPP
jgi:hypothetical protein